MFFKEKPLVTILLFVVIIVFAFLATINSNKLMEGMTTTDDDEIPMCADEDAPACYSTVQYDSYTSDYITPDLDDNYILKTEIVPPVCPACPSVINQHSHDGEVTSDSSSLGGSELNENNTLGGSKLNETNITNITNEENVTNKVNETVNTSIQKTNVVDNPELETQEVEDETAQSQNNNNIQSFSNQNDSLVQEYEKQINELKSELDELRQRSAGKDGECPPCPPCDRCPEPVFSCEKVINYRSPSVGQYLPMPVLGDFSTFKE